MIEVWKIFVIPILVVISLVTALIGVTFFILYAITVMFEEWTMAKREQRKLAKLARRK